MSTIFGILYKNRDCFDQKGMQHAMKALKHFEPDESSTWSLEHIAFGNHLLITSKREELEIMPYVDSESGCCITADCRIDYREELADNLGVKREEIQKLPDSQLIMQAYLKWGKECVNHLTGDFAFAIWDENLQELFCARDQIGCRPFYYYEDDQYFIFSSSIIGILKVPGVHPKLREKYLPHNFGSKVLPNGKTIYQYISRLSPSHSLIVKIGNKTIPYKYWDLEIDPEFSNISIDQAIEIFLHLFKEAVLERIKDVADIGLELSGGLDSSSIAAILQETKGTHSQVHAFIHSMTERQKENFYPFNDESVLSKRMAKYANLDSWEYITGDKGKGTLEALIAAMSLTCTPVTQLFPIFSDQLLDAVKSKKIRVLLSGFGGDEFVSNRATGVLDELAQFRKWSELIKHLKYRTRLGRITAFFELFIKHKLPFFVLTFQQCCFQKNRKRKFRGGNMTKIIANPYRNLRRPFTKSKGTVFLEVRELQKQNLFKDHVVDRLENSYLIAQNRKIVYSYPLLDIRILKFVYSLPAGYKNMNGQGRYLMRKAMEGLIPDDIRLRDHKFGAAMPNIFYRLNLDSDLFVEIIEEGRKNNNFHYFNYDALLHQVSMLANQRKIEKLRFGPRLFFSSISLLIMQRWQREGKINIEIQC